MTAPLTPAEAAAAALREWIARAVTLHAPWCGAVVEECDCQEAAPSDRTVEV